MTIINNRRKICSEVPSDKYKDNFDAIFGKKKSEDTEAKTSNEVVGEEDAETENKDGNT